MEIERASESDAHEILVLQKTAYLSEAEICHDFTIEPLQQTMEEFVLQFRDHIILKAVEDMTIIGSVRAKKLDKTCYIGKLMVHPGCQNQGIGKQLMHSIEGLYPHCRYVLFTGSKSEKNIRLYEKLGYTVFRKHPVSHDFGLIYLEKPVPPR